MKFNIHRRDGTTTISLPQALPDNPARIRELADYGLKVKTTNFIAAFKHRNPNATDDVIRRAALKFLEQYKVYDTLD